MEGNIFSTFSLFEGYIVMRNQLTVYVVCLKIIRSINSLSIFCITIGDSFVKPFIIVLNGPPFLYLSKTHPKPSFC